MLMSLIKANKIENDSIKRCLITGASGFVGSALLNSLDSKHYIAVPVYRQAYSNAACVAGINKDTDWSSSLKGIDVIIHCAARVHIMADTHHDSMTEFRKVNVDGTLNLARQAAKKGAKRFIFISSIKVNGESTFKESVFTEDLQEAPEDPYATSKHEAESGLREISDQTGLEVVIIRPPLVYGPGVKANFYTLLRLASTGLPLPFGAVNNKRSMVFVGNLVDFIVNCIDHPAAANQTFLVSDTEDLSLAELLTYLRRAFGLPARLLPVPVTLFKILGFLSGKQAIVERLVGDLQIDPSKAQDLLDWRPPFSIEKGIKITADAFKKDKD